MLVDLSASQPNVTKGGVIIPENAIVELQPIGKVVSVGQGVMTSHGWDKPQVKVGDLVKFERGRTPWVDKENGIIALWAHEIIGVEAEADLVRANGKLVEAVR